MNNNIFVSLTLSMFIYILACQSIWHSKYMYYLSNIKIIHAKMHKILLLLMLHTSINFLEVYFLYFHCRSSR